MQVLGIFFGTLAIAVAQFPHRFSNPRFRNVRTPLATSASKDNPHLSIPISLMPDGKIVPKASHINYQHLPQDGSPQQQNNQRSPKSQANFQLVLPLSSYVPKRKQKKAAQNAMSGNAANQPQQLYQNAKYMQQQNLQAAPTMHFQNQRNPTNQQQIIANLPNNDAYKQNFLNFINFASHLGAQVVSQQREMQKNQMQSTDVTYGQPVGSSPTQAQTDINMYLQSQTQTNSAPQIQLKAVQSTNYNIPQAQNQIMAAPVNFQYAQLNARPQTQAANQPAVYQFPGSQHNPIQANTFIQGHQQTLPQNYVVVSASQEIPANARPLTNVNFDPQSQVMKQFLNSQAHIETPNYDISEQIKNLNFGNQEGQTYVTPDGQQISFVNAAQSTPATYPTQQSLLQQLANKNASPTIRTSYGQHGDQKVYVSYQNPQGQSNGQQVAYRFQQPESSIGFQAPGSGKLIYATSSAKQIHYSPSGHSFTEEHSSPFAQFSDSSSSYKFGAVDDSEYAKLSPSGHFSYKPAKDDADDESEDGDVETSYKVVYVPLDILKNILNNNSVDNQRSDKAR